MFRIVNSVRTAAKRTAMTARRNFASDAAPPQYEGAEAAVRKVLPKDEQIVAAYIGIIASIVLIAKMTGSKKEEPVAVVSGDATGPVDMVPSMFSDKFDELVDRPIVVNHEPLMRANATLEARESESADETSASRAIRSRSSSFKHSKSP